MVDFNNYLLHHFTNSRFSITAVSAVVKDGSTAVRGLADRIWIIADCGGC